MMGRDRPDGCFSFSVRDFSSQSPTPCWSKDRSSFCSNRTSSLHSFCRYCNLSFIGLAHLGNIVPFPDTWVEHKPSGARVDADESAAEDEAVPLHATRASN